MKVKCHYFRARLLKPTTDSRAALMLSPMTTTTVTGSASRGTGVGLRPASACRSPPIALSLAARVPRIAVPAGEREVPLGISGPCSSRSWTGWSKGPTMHGTYASSRTDRDLSHRDLSLCLHVLCLHRRLSGHLCGASASEAAKQCGQAKRAPIRAGNGQPSHTLRLKRGFEALQRLLELGGCRFRLGLPLALLLDHPRARGDEFRVAELGVDLPDLGRPCRSRASAAPARRRCRSRRRAAGRARASPSTICAAPCGGACRSRSLSSRASRAWSPRGGRRARGSPRSRPTTTSGTLAPAGTFISERTERTSETSSISQPISASASASSRPSSSGQGASISRRRAPARLGARLPTAPR